MHALDACTPEWARADHRRPGRADRACGTALWRGPVAAVDRTGFPASAAGWQRGPRRRAARRAERQHRPARYGAAVPQRGRESRARRGLRRRRRAPRPDIPEPITHMDLTARLEDPAQPVRCSAGTSTSPRRIPSRRDCTRRSPVRICSPWSSTCSPPTPSTSPTSSCRRRASWSAMTSSRPTSISASSAQAKARAAGRISAQHRDIPPARRGDGYAEPALLESDRDRDRACAGAAGVDFRQLAARGTVWPHAEPVMQFADLGFPTPSGRIELACDAAEAAGLPRAAQPHAIRGRPAGGCGC